MDIKRQHEAGTYDSMKIPKYKVSGGIVFRLLHSVLALAPGKPNADAWRLSLYAGMLGALLSVTTDFQLNHA